jgi:hypothetical protein
MDEMCDHCPAVETAATTIRQLNRSNNNPAVETAATTIRRLKPQQQQSGG